MGDLPGDPARELLDQCSKTCDIVLGRNPRWWASPPHLDRIRVRAITGDTALTSALGRGQVQVQVGVGVELVVLAGAAAQQVPAQVVAEERVQGKAVVREQGKAVVREQGKAVVREQARVPGRQANPESG